eukprot:353447-Chlamydomonas_euryale.AAC.3
MGGVSCSTTGGRLCCTQLAATHAHPARGPGAIWVGLWRGCGALLNRKGCAPKRTDDVRGSGQTCMRPSGQTCVRPSRQAVCAQVGRQACVRQLRKLQQARCRTHATQRVCLDYRLSTSWVQQDLPSKYSLLRCVNFLVMCCDKKTSPPSLMIHAGALGDVDLGNSKVDEHLVTPSQQHPYRLTVLLQHHSELLPAESQHFVVRKGVLAITRPCAETHGGIHAAILKHIACQS